jgi:hypothetical protein
LLLLVNDTWISVCIDETTVVRQRYNWLIYTMQCKYMKEYETFSLRDGYETVIRLADISLAHCRKLK